MKRSAVVLLVGGLLATGTAQAHVPSTAQIVLSVEGRRLSGHWDVAVRDLQYAFGLDDDNDGKITWGEVKSHAGDLAGYFQSHLALVAGAAAIPLRCGAVQIDRRSDGAYLVMSLSAELPVTAPALRIDYDGFFALDPLHRGVLRLEWGGETVTAVFSPTARSHVFQPPEERGR